MEEEKLPGKHWSCESQNIKASTDWIGMAVNYSWNQLFLTKALYSQQECYASPDHRLFPDVLPSMYVRSDADVVKRMQQKDNTSALKLWLLQHKTNPYPSKPEKVMLAILAKMTLTQVSTWFANARRRLKKEYPDVE